MTTYTPPLIKTGLLCCGLLLAVQLNGCATATSTLECGVESLNPTVMAAVDSFESAALAIKLSNRVLLEMPVNEQDSWPDKLYGAPSGAGLLMMGLSLFGASQGITIPFDIDPKTGLPRPTSALYIFLREREQMLNKEVSREDVQFFRSQSARVIAREIPFHRRKSGEQLIDEHVYRNPLMAFGVVTANRDEMVRVQQDIDLLSQGFKQCDAWVHASREGDVKPAACQDPALRQDRLEARMKKASYTPGQPAPAPERQPTNNSPPEKPPRDLRDAVGDQEASSKPPAWGLEKKRQAQTSKDRRGRQREPVTLADAGSTKRSNSETVPMSVPEPDPVPAQGVIYVNEQDRQMAEKGEELETMRKNYGKLAGRVYNAAVAGADFTTAAIVKIGCAIVNGTRALPNIKNEFKGARGVYNIAMVASRIRMIINAFGYYQKNLGLQFTAYTTMYQQIKGTYPDLQDSDPNRAEKTAQALLRIEQAATLLQELEPRLNLLAQGQVSQFSDHDLARLAALARHYPDQRQIEQDFLLAWQGITEH